MCAFSHHTLTRQHWRLKLMARTWHSLSACAFDSSSCSRCSFSRYVQMWHYFKCICNVNDLFAFSRATTTIVDICMCSYATHCLLILSRFFCAVLRLCPVVLLFARVCMTNCCGSFVDKFSCHALVTTASNALI